MSRGLGRIQRAIEAAFGADPDNAFTVEDLCDRVYPGIARIEKKHRVAVLRAARNLSKARDDIGSTTSWQLGGTRSFYNLDSPISRMMAALKCGDHHHYRSNDGRISWRVIKTEAELKRMAHAQVAPGHWAWFETEIWRAERRGDHDEASELRAQLKRTSEELQAKVVEAVAARFA